MKFYNSLTRSVDEFSPLNPEKVTIYTCGPTVYDYVTIGNWRTYVLGDLIVRSVKYMGHDVNYVMNITDVGHLTGDNEGDSSIGEDRQEKAAKREGKSAWDLAEYYAKDFLDGFEKLNLLKPMKFTKATDYIKEQIDLVGRIEKVGLSYSIEDDGIYFDVKKYESGGNKYGELSNIDEVKEGVRVEINLNKKDPRDFALWKFSKKDENRHMEWDSPWGVGFPGWHAECSAMILAELGEQIDIHVGGEDLKSTHHPNEIVQSEVVTGKKPFVRHWVHGAFLLVDGGRMGKSLGNAHTVSDLIEKGYEPLALKYFYLSGHYKKQLNFTWKSLDQSQQAYDRLRSLVFRLGDGADDNDASTYEKKFREAVSEDFSFPKALAVLWDLMRDEKISDRSKKKLVKKFDKVLGLNLFEKLEEKIPEDILRLVEERERHRQNGDWKLADVVRDALAEEGFEVGDTSNGPVVRRIRRKSSE
ncbi:cysteine--tRNA ligase [Patescibacteria group bacterium]